ncbi:unnamed protein product [Porites evermanni]|uniref:Uncharacterized protein n=1 Tax=Porites evermanni TaxID=104178 RepID=A0ABN8QBB7_9CNID|nr:unnamed protein product [Porites evermanni]
MTVLFKLSLKSLAFDALITPDKESGLSRLQSACIEGDVETFTAIQSNSPSKLDSFVALNVKIRANSLYFPSKSVWAVLILQQSPRHRQIFTRVETICQEFHSQSLLHLTAREGQVHHLRRLLDCGALVDGLENDWDEPQQTPLMLAAKFNDEEVVEFLIERGASLEMRDDQDRTPFHYAAEGGKVRNLLRLIEHGVDVLQKDEHGYSALHLAASNGHTNSVRLLIEHGADVNEFTSSLDEPGYTPLMLAAEKGNLQTVQVLLQNAGDPHRGNEMAWLPLHFAAKGDHTEMVKFLLEHDGNVLAATACGKTVLHLATRLDLVMILVYRGANIQAKDILGRTPLHVAAEKGQSDTVNYLLDHGADVNSRDRNGLLALYCALKGGHATTAKFLMDRGSESLLSNDPNLLGSYEADLLQSSAREGLVDIVEFLLNSGVYVDAVPSNGDSLLTPLEEAASTGHCDVVTILLEQGADINGNVSSRRERLRERQIESFSWEDRYYLENICPLFAALHAGQGEVAKLLLERGANISNLKCGSLQALSDLAAEHGLFDVLKLLDNYALDDMEGYRLKGGDTILTSAVGRMDFPLVSHLLQNGMDVNKKNEFGNTALHIIFLRGMQDKKPQKAMEMFKLLVSFGADINAINNTFETPLHYAVDFEAEECISLLLELDCKIDFEVPLKESPLILATLKGKCKLVEELLQCGADVNQKCGRDEQTPLHAVVKSFNRPALAQIMLLHGADLETKDFVEETPLTKALEMVDEELVEVFLNWGSTVNTINKFGETTLMKAVEHPKVWIVKTLLEHGASVNATDQRGRSPLHHMASHAVEVCKLLLDNGSCVNITDDDGETPLHQATYDPQIVKILLDHTADVRALDKKNLTPLHAASYEGVCRSVELLIQSGADLNAADNQGWTPLHIAAAAGRLDTVRVLIQNGSDIAAVVKTGRTALHLAGKRGRRSVVELLINHGSDINSKDYRGHSILGAMFKCRSSEMLDYGNWDIVKYYLEHGGDKFAVDGETGRTTLHFAASHQFLSTVDELLDQQLALEARDKNGETPLHRAVASGTDEIIKHLVDRGADVRAVNKRGQTPLLVSLARHRSNLLLKHKPNVQQADGDGNTPLHLAIYNPRNAQETFYDPLPFSTDDVSFLLKAGADIHSRDKQGNTPLHVAAAEDRYEIAELLIKEGSKVNSTNVRGQTCLHMASYSGALDIVEMLVAYGADLNVVDELGCTPLHVALTSHRFWLVEPLLNHGSNPKAVDYKGSTPLHVGCCYDDDNDELMEVATNEGYCFVSTDEWVSLMINYER